MTKSTLQDCNVRMFGEMALAHAGAACDCDCEIGRDGEDDHDYHATDRAHVNARLCGGMRHGAAKRGALGRCATRRARLR